MPASSPSPCPPKPRTRHRDVHCDVLISRVSCSRTVDGHELGHRRVLDVEEVGHELLHKVRCAGRSSMAGGDDLLAELPHLDRQLLDARQAARDVSDGQLLMSGGNVHRPPPRLVLDLAGDD